MQITKLKSRMFKNKIMHQQSQRQRLHDDQFVICPTLNGFPAKWFNA